MRIVTVKDFQAPSGGPEGALGHGRRSRVPLLLFAPLSVLAAMLVLRVIAHVVYPFPLDLGEGVVLSTGWAARAASPYNVISDPPCIFTIYNPIYVYLTAACLEWLGAIPLYPRALGALFLFASALVLFRFVKRETGSRAAGLAAAFAFLLARPVYARAGYAVTDWPALFFSLTGLYLWRSGGRTRYLALVSFALAFFSKQVSVIAAAAAFASLFLEGRRLESIRLFALWLALLGAGYAVIAALLGMPFFVNTFSYAGKAAYDALFAARGMALLVTLSIVPFAAWLVFAVRARREPRLLLPALYGAFGFCIALTSGRVGASRSYYFDFVAALAVFAGYLWAAAEARLAAGRSRRLIAALVLLQVALIAVGVVYKLRPLGDPTRSTFLQDREVRLVFFERSGIILARDAGFDLDAPSVGASNDPYKLQQLIEAGVVPPDAVRRHVSAKRFSAIVVPDKKATVTPFDDDTMREVLANYRLLRAAHGISVYVPIEEPAGA